MDRPEDIQAHPTNGKVYAVFMRCPELLGLEIH
jgi:secreted PhoX family phosphatase